MSCTALRNSLNWLRMCFFCAFDSDTQHTATHQPTTNQQTRANKCAKPGMRSANVCHVSSFSPALTSLNCARFRRSTSERASSSFDRVLLSRRSTKPPSGENCFRNSVVSPPLGFISKLAEKRIENQIHEQVHGHFLHKRPIRNSLTENKTLQIHNQTEK